MYTNRRWNTSLGFLVGAVVGSVAALLLAPKSGKDSQRWVADTVKEGVALAKEQTGELRDQVRQWAKKSKGLVNNVAEGAKDIAS